MTAVRISYGRFSVILAAGLFLAGCRSEHAAAPAAPTVPVTVAQVAEKSVPLNIEAIGSVLPYRTVSLEPQVTGQLMSVHFQEGQDVKKGALLFSIDPAPFRAALDQALGKLAHDKAQAANSTVSAQRGERLFAEKVISREQVDLAQATAQEDQAAVRTDEAAVEYARLQLGYCSVYSPLDGRTGGLLLHPGNQVKANDVPVLVVINQITPVFVAYAIPERYLPLVRKYMAKGSLPVDAVVPGDPQHPEPGTLTFVDNAVDRATGTIQLKATFPNRDRRLWPGQFVNTIVRLAEQTNAIVVPAQAIETGQKGTFVYVLKTDQTAEIRPVTVERNAGGYAVVSSGLRPGETVVTDGQIMIFPGAHLQVKSSPASSVPPGQ
jgi:membrane fusion protein, multidrug efflux system